MRFRHINNYEKNCNYFWSWVLSKFLIQKLNALGWIIYCTFRKNEIIDSLAENKAVQQVYLPAVIYILLYFFTAINFRALDWIKYKILPPIKKDTAKLP